MKRNVCPDCGHRFTQPFDYLEFDLINTAKDIISNLEWVGDDSGIHCPVCYSRNLEYKRHKSGCSLKKWLKDYEASK